jgi:hypothetical protein
VRRLTKKHLLALAVVVAIGVIFLVATGRIDVLRLGLLAAACLLLPGLGWARRSHVRDAGDRLALAIAISICALTVIGSAMAVAGRWSTLAGAVGLVAIAAAGFIPHRALTAVRAGLVAALKWFIHLFAGPDEYSPVSLRRVQGDASPDDRGRGEALVSSRSRQA